MNALQRRIVAFDTALYFRCLATGKLPAIPILSRMISRLGDGGFYLLIGILLAGFEPANGMDFLQTGLMVFALELPLYLFIKQAFKRDRPCDRFIDIEPIITPSDKFSFPSGHAAAAFVFASILSYYYPVIIPVAYTIAMLIGLSRVLLGVHYPSDIVAGALLGGGCALIGLHLIEIF